MLYNRWNKAENEAEWPLCHGGEHVFCYNSYEDYVETNELLKKEHGNLYNNIIGNCHIFINTINNCNSVNHLVQLELMTDSCSIDSWGTCSAMQVTFIMYPEPFFPLMCGMQWFISNELCSLQKGNKLY